MSDIVIAADEPFHRLAGIMCNRLSELGSAAREATRATEALTAAIPRQAPEPPEEGR